MLMSQTVIVFNAGSSSLKFSLYDETARHLIFHGQVDDIPGEPTLAVFDKNQTRIHQETGFSNGHEAALSAVLVWHEAHSETTDIKAAGHRIVHGGQIYTEAAIMTDTIIKQLETLIPLAPLHQPHNLAIAKVFRALHPSIPQIACFDTAFHRSQSVAAEKFALPRKYYDEGILRYGFHGLSYAYITSVLPSYIGDKADGRIIVAHLGNGASMCAINRGKSVSTTMGFTALDGLMMGTRCGALDPGIALYLMSEKGMSVEEVTRMLYQDSGLKGISNISHDMRDLLESDAPEAREAIDLFCYHAAKQLAGLIPSLGGLDALVFTAGIGEGSSVIRDNICWRLSWLGVSLDRNANESGQCYNIHSPESAVDVYVIPTNEELMIARMTIDTLKQSQTGNKDA